MNEKEIMSYRNVPTEVASKFLGIDVSTLRYGLQDRRFPFGTAVKRKGSQRWTYQISPQPLIDYYKKGVKV